MRYPIGFMMAQGRHRSKMEKSGHKRYPTVVMLEPLYTCNLACLGCSIERHTGKLSDRLSVEQCLKAVDECGAPIVNICGGEPLVYPELKELVEALLARGKYIIICTNALLMEKKFFGVVDPHPNLFLMIHLDGMQETHDYVCNRKGVFENAIKVIKKAKELGYMTYLNTTVFKETKVEEVQELCELVDELKANGILISPGYEYESVEQDIFPDQRPDSRQIQGDPQFFQQIQGQRNAHVFGVCRRNARTALRSVVNSELHANGLESPLLSCRRNHDSGLGHVLEQDQLGILGKPPRSKMRELQNAQRI